MEPIEFSEIPKLLNIKQWEVKNWITGRPFTIKASVKQARGSGSRNLYGMEDLWKFEIVRQAIKAGIRNDPINKVLERLQQDFELPDGLERLQNSAWLLIYRKQNYEWSIQYGKPGDVHPTLEPGSLQLLIDVPATKQKLKSALNDLEAEKKAKLLGTHKPSKPKKFASARRKQIKKRKGEKE
jgi:hypothetical protein